jgi:hypothetical protein
MTQEEAAVDRRVITTARAVERAAQYGIDARGAVQAYENARTDQARQRRAVNPR